MEWNPEQAPQATVMNKMGNNEPNCGTYQVLKAGYCMAKPPNRIPTKPPKTEV